jgi:hypothetical protein
MFNEIASIEKLYSFISQMTFSSLCGYVKQAETENFTAFGLKHSFHGSSYREDFFIVERNGVLYLSDMSNTIANVNEVLKVNIPLIAKNIETVVEHYGFVYDRHVLAAYIDSAEELMPQVFHYLQGIHFLLAMKLFYHGNYDFADEEVAQ